MNDKEKKPGNPWTRHLLIYIGVVFLVVLVVEMMEGGSRAAGGQSMAYSEFVRQVDEGNVRTVSMSTGSTGNSEIAGKLDSGEDFHTVAPAGANIADHMIQKGVGVQVKADEQGSIWLYMLYNSLPFLLMIG
ncbi:ATP-dependent metallopeptidase FtsH/Yme1/Tma family protein, partial [Sphingomonas sp.]|uniref:ATP-dependent metallopeptidase FtsH/Yme1/Tma family protein n=1 Tax=Sphingomonas sp. TaxID=28214 RepID=UPI0025D4549B